MTLDELTARFPLGCEVELTPHARAIGMGKMYHGERGTVEGYNVRIDLANKQFLCLRICLDGRNDKRWGQPSQWQPVAKDPQ